jgi:hypothetical protein
VDVRELLESRTVSARQAQKNLLHQMLGSDRMARLMRDNSRIALRLNHLLMFGKFASVADEASVSIASIK